MRCDTSALGMDGHNYAYRLDEGRLASLHRLCIAGAKRRRESRQYRLTPMRQSCIDKDLLHLNIEFGVLCKKAIPDLSAKLGIVAHGREIVRVAIDAMMLCVMYTCVMLEVCRQWQMYVFCAHHIWSPLRGAGQS